MRALLIVCSLLFLLAACTPQSPTGNTISGTMSWVDRSPLVTVYPLDSLIGDPQVRVEVRGDLVYSTIRIDGEAYPLSGEHSSEGWIKNKGVAVIRLPPGGYDLDAYVCFDTLSGWECGCSSSGVCGNWMRRSFGVPEKPFNKE